MCVKEKNNQITESEGVDMQRNCTILTRQEMENLESIASIARRYNVYATLGVDEDEI